jgi:hypothetical protein
MLDVECNKPRSPCGERPSGLGFTPNSARVAASRTALLTGETVKLWVRRRTKPWMRPPVSSGLASPGESRVSVGWVMEMQVEFPLFFPWRSSSLLHLAVGFGVPSFMRQCAVACLLLHARGPSRERGGGVCSMAGSRHMRTLHWGHPV